MLLEPVVLKVKIFEVFSMIIGVVSDKAIF